MLISDIKRVIEQVSRDKGIDSEILVRTLEEALRSAAKKKFGNKMDIEVKFNEDMGEIEVFQFKEVVEEIEDPDTQITIEEGLRLDPECEIGDSLGAKMDTTTFGRIAAQSAKQVIIQKMKDAERDAIFGAFIDRKGEIINGIVQRVDRNHLIVNLGQTEAILPGREQMPKESYRRGDRIRAYIMDVRNETHGPQIVLSRTHPEFLVNLFRTEVPEISEGIVSIMGAVREPGSRGKIAVASNDSDIDPVGACVGIKGSRVQNVVQELRGEKIDIIPWHVDPAKFVCNALAPAEISRVIIDEENRSMEVIVPDDHLSVAIGRKGQNVRLASKLTKWRLDVKSESRYSKVMKEGYESLISLPGVGISLADALYENGLYSVEEISKSSAEEIMRIRAVADEEEAESLILMAREYMAEVAAQTAAAETEAAKALEAETTVDAEDGAADISADSNAAALSEGVDSAITEESRAPTAPEQPDKTDAGEQGDDTDTAETEASGAAAESPAEPAEEEDVEAIREVREAEMDEPVGPAESELPREILKDEAAASSSEAVPSSEPAPSQTPTDENAQP
jgi:transcription termination/antitermination protein NusA